MTVEKHLLQDWQNGVLLLWFPVGLGLLPFFLALLGEVLRGLVVGLCRCQLGVHACEEQMSEQGGCE